MKAIRPVILTVIFNLLIFQLYSQSSVVGFYENQTAATERMGEIIDVKPNNKVFWYIKLYGKTILKSEGTWSLRHDSLLIDIGGEIKILEINNENLLSTFPIPHKDTIVNGEKRFIVSSQTFWTKTISYFENGNIESKRTVKSISDISPDITPVGTWTFYFENGAVKATGRYKNGKKKGEWKYYSKDGTLKVVNE